MRFRRFEFALLCLGLFAVNTQARAGLLRAGDHIKLRLVAPANLMAMHTGDTLAVKIPEGFQAVPGSPEIPAGTLGTATLAVFQAGPTEFKFGFSSLAFNARSGRVRVMLVAKADAPTNATVPVVKANPTKKMFLPPLLGALIWKDRAPLGTTTDLGADVDQDIRW